MDIDVTVLRSLEAEKDISMDLVIKAIEDALLVAYHKSDGAAPTARVEVNRNTGHVTVWAAETDENGMRLREYDQDRSSCSGCVTPRMSSPSGSSPARRATSSPA